jgi:hypothetical protein
MKVRADDASLTSRAGTALLVGLADRVGLTGALVEALADLRFRRGRHRPGQVLRDLGVMLADGGDTLCDLGALRDQEVLFGAVASDATAWRLIAALDEKHLAKVRAARATARQRVWALAKPPKRLILDLDATLVTAHFREGRRGWYLQARLWLPPPPLLRGHPWGSARRHPASRQRRREHGLGPH